MATFFARFSNRIATAAGHYLTFLLAIAIIIGWAISGPLFGFSDTWQLVINTGTTIVTFLMVFLIQNTQNRDGTATQLKLDEIIRAISQANDALIDTEDATDKELQELRKHYKLLADQHKELQTKFASVAEQDY